MHEKIHRIANKLLPGLTYLSYKERLKECGSTTLETRKLRGDQIDALEISNGHGNIYPNIFFIIKTNRTTVGLHDVTLVKGQSSLDLENYCSQMTINEWNKLSADCVHSSSIKR